jgi:predicted phage terminase large subunit-like protein
MVVAHAAAKAQRQVVQEAYKERVQEEAAKSAQLVAEAVKMEMKKGMDDAAMLLHEVHRTTTSVVSPEQVQEIMRNVEMIRAPTDGLTTEQLVKRELVIRELCRRKLIYFTARRRPDYILGWFNIDLAERLERFGYAVQAKMSPRLLVAAPPRHGKSALVSEDFPAWFQGIMPKAEIIASSYNDELAADFSRAVQNIMREEGYKALFEGLTVSDWSKGISAWENSKYGKYRATGVGGALTGRGAHVLIIEDPYKNRQEADSPVNRKKIWDWYTSTAYTRLMPGGGVVVVATRWSADDLSGRLLEQLKTAEKEYAKSGEWPLDADRWEVVSYPAIAVEDETHRKEGEPLHAERYSLRDLLRIRRTQTLEGDPRDWASLYQQTPVPDEGAYFTKEMIKFYDGEEPPGLDLVGGDLAVTQQQWSDYTVMLIGRLDKDDNFYIYDGFRGKIDSAEILEKIFEWQRKYKPAEFGLGKDVIEKSIGPFIDNRIRSERLYELIITPIPHSNHDKAARARPIQGRMKQGKVLLKRGAAFLEWFLPEVLMFPNGKKDDVIDSMANLGVMLADRTYIPPPVQQPKSWRDKLNGLGSGSRVNSSMAA